MAADHWPRATWFLFFSVISRPSLAEKFQIWYWIVGFNKPVRTAVEKLYVTAIKPAAHAVKVSEFCNFRVFPRKIVQISLRSKINFHQQVRRTFPQILVYRTVILVHFSPLFGIFNDFSSVNHCGATWDARVRCGGPRQTGLG